MARDEKYGHVILDRSINEGEPLFVLRGQDCVAESALRFYYEMVSDPESECSEEFAESVHRALARFTEYGSTHQRKFPD